MAVQQPMPKLLTVCPMCRKELLDLTQPDKRMASRFLGVCHGCGAWYVVDQPKEEGDVKVTPLKVEAA
jgi:hypothetical protein